MRAGSGLGYTLSLMGLSSIIARSLFEAQEMAEMSARELRKKLRANDCVELRQKGSHLQVKCGGCQSTVPVHGNDDIAKGTFRSIEKSLGVCLGPNWTRVEFMDDEDATMVIVEGVASGEVDGGSLARLLEAAASDFARKAQDADLKADKALSSVGLTRQDVGPVQLGTADLYAKAKGLSSRGGYTEKQIVDAIKRYQDNVSKAERMKSKASKVKLGEYGRGEAEAR